MTFTVKAEDTCSAPSRTKGTLLTHGERMEIEGDRILIDGGRTTFVRLEPHGLGDVHWELLEEGTGRTADHPMRFTDIAITAEVR